MSEPGTGGDDDARPAVDCLLHHAYDDVAVALYDLSPGVARGRVLDDHQLVDVVVTEPVPRGHKVAVRTVAEGQQVTEHARTIGLAVVTIPAGRHVHTHNLRSARWPAQA